MLATVLQPTSLESIKKGGEDKSVSMPRNAQRNKYRHVLGQWDLQEGLNVEVVSGEDNLEKHLLIDRDELLVPLADVGRPLASLVLALLGIGSRQRLPPMVLAVLEDLWRAPKSGTLPPRTPSRTERTFFRTLEETLGSGMG